MKYVAQTGINYRTPDGGEKRVEAGGIVPPYVIQRSPWLIEQGHVLAVKDTKGGGD